MPLLRGGLKHTIRKSRGLPPLQIYNTRIIWRRKGRIWWPKDIYRSRRRFKKLWSIFSYNADKFYRRLSKKKKYKKRLRFWRLPYSIVDRTYWYVQHLWKLKKWAARYRLPIYFKKFYWKLRLWKYRRSRTRRLKKLRGIIRYKDPRMFVKYLTAPEERKANSKMDDSKRIKANSKSVYSRGDSIRMLNSFVYKPFILKKSSRHKLWLKQYNSIMRKKRRYILNNIITRFDMARRRHFLGKFVLLLSDKWFIKWLDVRMLYSIQRLRVSRAGFSQVYTNTTRYLKNKKKFSKRTWHKLEAQCAGTIVTNFRMFFDVQKTKNTNNDQIMARYEWFNSDDAFIPIILNNPVFFNDLYYFSTKVRSLPLLCVLWFSTSNVYLFNLLQLHKSLGICFSLFFFRHAYFSEFSSGLRLYSRRHTSVLPLLLQWQQTVTIARIAPANDVRVLLFIIKYMYIEFIYSFLSTVRNKITIRTLMSYTFFVSLLCCYGSNLTSMLAKALNKNSIRTSLFNFMTAYINKRPTRLLFVLRSTANSVFFLFWVLRLYIGMHNELRIRSLINKMFIILLCMHRKLISDMLVFVMLRLSSISMLLRSLRYRANLEKHYAITSFVCNYHLDNFRIYNAGLSLFMYIFIVGTNRYPMRELLFRYGIKLFTHQIEYTLFSFTKVQYLFFARYYYMTIPPLNNARMLCNYIIIKIATGSRIKDAFDGVYTWQTYWTDKLATNYDAGMRDALYPVKGIRIICSGPPYKARRTTTVRYLSWVSDEYLTGKMPLSTVNLNIEYVQSHVVLRRSTIGIKVWLLLEEEVSLAM